MGNEIDILGLVVGAGLASIITLVIILIGGLGSYFMARKSGESTAWLSFIPFLKWVPYLGMIYRRSWNVLWLLVPVVNIVLMVVWMMEILRVFDRRPAIIILWLLVPGFSVVYPFYLGLSRDVEYIG